MCLSACKTTLGMSAVNLSTAESTIYASQNLFLLFFCYIVRDVTCGVGHVVRLVRIEIRWSSVLPPRTVRDPFRLTPHPNCGQESQPRQETRQPTRRASKPELDTTYAPLLPLPTRTISRPKARPPATCHILPPRGRPRSTRADHSVIGPTPETSGTQNAPASSGKGGIR